MAHFYRSHPVFSCIVCSLAILRSIGGGNITWFEPLPSETVTDPSSVSTTNKSLIKGSLSEKLSCNFTLTAGLRIITVSMKIGRTAVATFVPSERAPAIESDFASRFHATWVPNKLTLILLNVTDAEEGDYLCQVVSVSPAQTWIRKIHVSLLVPPSITEIMGKTVREGENLTLRCLAEGKPTPHITWTRLSDNSVVTMPLINISRQDVRDYRCKAHNGVGTPASKKVSINVQYPVEAVGSGGNTTVHERGVTNFSCPVDGNPEPSIMWYEGTEVGGGKISSEKQLTVEVNSGESVCYTCVANNSLGTSVSITQCLIVKQHSTAPTHPSTPIPVRPPLTVIGLVTGVVVLVVVVIIGLVAWWVLKKRKLTKDRKQGELQHLEVDNMDSGEKLE